MAGSKDRSGSKPEASGEDFDGVWEAMADRAPDKTEGATKLWNDDVRGARKRGEAETEGEPEAGVTPRAERTVAWTDEVRGARKGDHPGEPKDEMARLMAEAAAAPVADDDEDAPAPASTSMVGAAFVDMRPAAEPASDAMARLMGPREAETPPDPGPSAAEAEDSPESEDAKPPDIDGEADGEADGDAADESVVAAPIPLRPRPSGAVLVAEPEPQLGSDAPADADEGSRAWMWIAAAVVVGGLGFAAMQSGETAPAATGAVGRAEATAPAGVPAAAQVAGDEPRPGKDAAALASQATGANEAPDEAPAGVVAKPAQPRSGDPREAPVGTPQDTVEVFKRIPVSAADQPPVGGIGATGVHIDDIAMGTGYARSRCEGESESFSVADAGQANVCLRVVHQRQKEELVIVWQKKNGHARRGKIVVKAAHAYRTRAYLKLRSEYVGEWDVKILSGDGVELAAQSFSIVP